MLRLRDIKKDYFVADQRMPALRGVSIGFRKSEFVAILGASGCGKTTLLNIIGGLDRYTSGDLSINGVSTKLYKDRDWDVYRNHSVGFVFQSYHLMPHQTVVANVELALTLSGVSQAERRRRAVEALEKVGLTNSQLHKLPRQMSGGQMQRVAIARAIVNNPEILLADEPTGALDSVTSVQIMDILKELSRTKLVIMVTHNPELAEQYADRIVKIKDGELLSDTNPYTEEQEAAEEQAAEKPVPVKAVKRKKGKEKKSGSMSFFTALSLSFRNLMTKKGRTFMVSFAGSIGIIGIALILSVATGVNAYIDGIERSTMSSYPLQIQSSTFDMSAMLGSFMENSAMDFEREPDTVISHNVMTRMMGAISG
ncbi:MAG: ABC transporter ATP-binding protein, partial [Clostridia bacterium]|nr:ABC transporter ATP-binding protein [Clostridia bacterium]